MHTTAEKIAKAVKELHAIREGLCADFKHWDFTLDGKLIGDIGEAYAYSHYALDHLEGDGAVHDFISLDGRHVQVKITQKSNLGLGLSAPSYDYLLAFYLSPYGEIEEIYNGAGPRVYSRPEKPPIRSISVVRLRQLQANVPDEEKIQKRESNKSPEP